MNIRVYDTVARWGGEEFTVILPNSDKEGALKIAERIRRAVEEHVFYWEGRPLKMTVSIGTATTNESIGVEEFVNMVDKALYKAKEKKNLVVAA